MGSFRPLSVHVRLALEPRSRSSSAGWRSDRRGWSHEGHLQGGTTGHRSGTEREIGADQWGPLPACPPTRSSFLGAPSRQPTLVPVERPQGRSQVAGQREKVVAPPPSPACPLTFAGHRHRWEGVGRVLHLALQDRVVRALVGRQGQLAAHGVRGPRLGLHGREVPDGCILVAGAPGHAHGLRREEPLH